jgi:hypothetical protein
MFQQPMVASCAMAHLKKLRCAILSDAVHHRIVRWVIGRSGQVAMLIIRSRKFADAVWMRQLRMAERVVKTT